jgi:sugar lactone lactonase YvrE
MKKYLLLISVILSSFCNAQNQQTFAGSTEPGLSDGITGENANFNWPFAITSDSNGFFYVADTYSNCIRKVSQNGNSAITIAGSINSLAGTDDGIGSLAKFYRPAGIVVDQNGNIYVADTGNHRIRKITPTGIVSTFAGSSQGYLNGQGTLAKFDCPYGLAIDISGNIYVADSAYDNGSDAVFGRIRKITPNGLVSNFYSTNEQLFRPTDVTIDNSGNLYVVSRKNIYKINTNGQLINSYTTDNDPINTINAYGWGIEVDVNDNIYVTIIKDVIISPPSNPAIYGIPGGSGPSPNQVRKITPNGYQTIEVSSGLYSPFGVCINNNNDIFIADVRNNRIAKLTTSGLLNNFVGENLGNVPSANSGCVSFSAVDGQGEITKAHFNNLNGLGQDSNGNIYVADTNNHRIRKITPSGNVSTLVGSIAGFNNGNSNQALLHFPNRIFVDSNNNIYTLTRKALADLPPGGDITTMIIRKISPNGDVSGFPQNNQNLGIINNTVVVGGLVVDQIGNVYVTSFNLIQKITPNGVVSTLAGDWSSGYANGLGTAARFNEPRGLCIDPSGNIYVADSGNNRIRKITPNGLVTTLATSTTVAFNHPNFVSYYGGNIYFSEGPEDISCNGKSIKKITATNEVYTVCQTCGGGGSVLSNANNIYVIKGNQINILSDQSLGINQNLFSLQQINLYPNPAKDEITIDLSKINNIENFSYEIYNSLGQEVQNGILNSQINIIHLNNIKGSGVYFVKIIDSSNTLIDSKKIIIQH